MNSISVLCHSPQIEVPDMTTKISTAVEHFQVVEIAKTEQQRQLFRPYQEHVDRLVCDALKNAIDTRYALLVDFNRKIIGN